MSEENIQTKVPSKPVEVEKAKQAPAEKPKPRRRSSDFVSPGLVDYEPPVLGCLSLVPVYWDDRFLRLLLKPACHRAAKGRLWLSVLGLQSRLA